MATIAQGVQAGNLAAGLQSLTAFVQALNAAVAAAGQVTQISLSVNSQMNTITLNPPAPLTVSDSATLLNAIVSLAGGLNAGMDNPTGGDLTPPLPSRRWMADPSA